MSQKKQDFTFYVSNNDDFDIFAISLNNLLLSMINYV